MSDSKLPEYERRLADRRVYLARQRQLRTAQGRPYWVAGGPEWLMERLAALDRGEAITAVEREQLRRAAEVAADRAAADRLRGR